MRCTLAKQSLINICLKICVNWQHQNLHEMLQIYKSYHQWQVAKIHISCKNLVTMFYNTELVILISHGMFIILYILQLINVNYSGKQSPSNNQYIYILYTERRERGREREREWSYLSLWLTDFRRSSRQQEQPCKIRREKEKRKYSPVELRFMAYGIFC